MNDETSPKFLLKECFVCGKKHPSKARMPRSSCDDCYRRLTDEHRLSEIRSVVASNPTVSVALLRELAKCQDPTVRCAVARAASTPADVLAELSADPAVALPVAAHPNTPADVLERLAALKKEDR